MDEDIYNFFQKKEHDNLKTNLLLFPLKVEYNIISDFLFNSNIMRTFFSREMGKICETLFQTKDSKDKNTNIKDNDKNDFNYLILPTNDETKEIFKAKCLCKKQFLNHSLLILRFIKEEDSKKNNNVNSNTNNFFIDAVISFYIDISNNSTVIINELYSNLSDSLFIKFNSVVHLFYEKLNVFIREKMNKFYCFESILIPKNINYIFNYLSSCKIFHNEKFKIQKIQRVNHDIEISCQFAFTEKVHESKLLLRYLSDNNCLVEIVGWMKTEDFTTQEKLLNLKSIISVFLKKLRCRIKKECTPDEKQKETKNNES